MATDRRLIVGLGNPGPDYEHTRHNVGFEVVRALGRHLNIAWDAHSSRARGGWGSFKGTQIGLAMPLTFMNRSGGSVSQLLEANDISLQHLLIVVDDLNLELGAIRMRPDGSAGGHNGIQDIIDRLGTDAFPRMRIGIGSNFPPGGQVEYVLSPFTPQELPTVEETVDTARQAALMFAAEGLHEAMNRFNRRSG